MQSWKLDFINAVSKVVIDDVDSLDFHFGAGDTAVVTVYFKHPDGSLLKVAFTAAFGLREDVTLRAQDGAHQLNRLIASMRAKPAPDDTRYVYLLTTGDGEDGNEWDCHGVFRTPDRAAEFAKTINQGPVEIEPWELDPEPRKTT